MAVPGDAASWEQSITTSDMCQVYYVSSFIELIYFVAVAFNQGCFTQTVEGWSGGWVGGNLHWSRCDACSCESGGNDSTEEEHVLVTLLCD